MYSSKGESAYLDHDVPTFGNLGVTNKANTLVHWVQITTRNEALQNRPRPDNKYQ